MTSSNAGWYPDPQDAQLMRWWDGSGWTEDTYERTEPLGGPLDHRTPFDDPSGTPRDASAAPVRSGEPRSSDHPIDPYLRRQGGAHEQARGLTYPTAPPSARSTSMGGRPVAPTTADGVPLASWGIRALARIIDGIIVTVVSLAATFPTVTDMVSTAWQEAERAARTGGSAAPLFTDPAMLAHLAYVTFAQLAVGLVYEVVFLLWKAATPGKLALGLRVRRWDAGQRLTPTVVVRRWLAYQGAQAVPYVGTPYLVIDLLWPVRDARRQALHDKFAKTCVVNVRGR
jgi:uncharacterized RDD family membrane protein YckC